MLNYMVFSYILEQNLYYASMFNFNMFYTIDTGYNLILYN